MGRVARFVRLGYCLSHWLSSHCSRPHVLLYAKTFPQTGRGNASHLKKLRISIDRAVSGCQSRGDRMYCVVHAKTMEGVTEFSVHHLRGI